MKYVDAKEKEKVGRPARQKLQSTSADAVSD
jgi:hypothetical protein